MRATKINNIILLKKRGERLLVEEKLYNLRKKLNLSQEEVADKLKVSRQTISKWETNQSLPDFDKISPLCELYNISADDLLNIKKIKKEENIKDYKEERKKTAFILTVSISLYFCSIIFVILATEVFSFNGGIISSGFLTICMIATALLIYHFTSRPKKEIIKEKKIANQIISVVAIIVTGMYLFISIYTMAWHITWIIWLIFAAICEIIKLFFKLREDMVEHKMKTQKRSSNN